MSTASILEEAAATSRAMAALEGRFLELIGELARREGWRAEGATSLAAWMVEGCGVSPATARAKAHVAARLEDLPHLSAGLSEGELTFDQARAVVDIATPENDREMRARASQCSVPQLADLARAQRGTSAAIAAKDRDARSLRFNDTFRTMTVQLPPESFAEVRACVESEARQLPSDGETLWDQRLCDGFLRILRAARSGGRRPADAPSPYFVVAHVPLRALLDEPDGTESALCGELERGDLISHDTVQRIACDATVAIAVDDDVGHTMFEGRSRRWPTDAQRREIIRRDRHCRFPGCTNITFTNAHHIVPWRSGGATDLDNLALLCVHHHHRVHHSQWRMSGNANEELTFVGPTGRVMTSRPSPTWSFASLQN